MSNMDELLIRAYFGFEMRKSPELPWVSRKQQQTDVVVARGVAGYDGDTSTKSKKSLAEGETSNSPCDRWTHPHTKSPVDDARNDVREWIRSEWAKSSASDSDIVKFETSEPARIISVHKSNSATIQVTKNVLQSECVKGEHAGEVKKPKSLNLPTAYTTPPLSVVGNTHPCDSSITQGSKSGSGFALPRESQKDVAAVSGNKVGCTVTSVTIPTSKRTAATSITSMAVRKRVSDVSLDVNFSGTARPVTTGIATANPKGVKSGVLNTNGCPDTVKVTTALVPIAMNTSTIIIAEPEEITRMKRKKQRELNTNELSVFVDSKQNKSIKTLNVQKVKQASLSVPVLGKNIDKPNTISEKKKKDRKSVNKIGATKVHPDKTSTSSSIESTRSADELARIADLFCVEVEAQAAKRKLKCKVNKNKTAKVTPSMFKSNNTEPAKRTREELAMIAAMFCVESEEEAIMRRMEQSHFSAVFFHGDDSEPWSFQTVVKDSNEKLLKEARSVNNTKQVAITTPSETLNDEPNTVKVAWEDETAKKTKKRRNPVVNFFRRLLKIGRN